MTSIGSTIKDIRKEKAELEYSLYEMASSLHFEEGNEEWIKGALDTADS